MVKSEMHPEESEAGWPPGKRQMSPLVHHLREWSARGDREIKESEMTELKVWVLFYGSFINLDVLRGTGLAPDRVEVARLGGFDIVVRPLANLIRSDQHSVYGILAKATHAELGRLYDYARDTLGGTYLPEAVLAETAGAWRPALCYIAPHMEPGAPSNDYIDRIVIPARQHGFPAWYLARLEAFRPV